MYALNILLLFIEMTKEKDCTAKLTYQSCTALNDSSFVMSYIKIKPIAPR